MRERKWVYLDRKGGGEETGGVEGGETKIKIYYGKKIYFQQKEKKSLVLAWINRLRNNKETF